MQRDYANIPYPAAGFEKATVASGGCGPTCMSILLGNLCGIDFPPDKAAQYAIKCGARISGGTDMRLLSACIARDSSLVRELTNDVGKLTDALKNGAVAVCNVGGDRDGHEGVFSDGGHYLVAVGVADDAVILVDPGMYDAKYSGACRSSKVNVLKEGILAADKAVLDGDCSNRSPRYYILSK